MRLRTDDFTGFSVLLSDVALMSSLFAMFTYLRSGNLMELRFLPWMICVTVFYLVNMVIQRKGVPVNTVIVMNVIATAGLCAAGVFFWADANSLATYLFAVIFFGISGGRSAYVAKNSVHPNQMLIYTEVCIFFLAFFLWEQSALPALVKYNTVLFTALCCDLISLILIRLVTENQTKVSGSKYQGLFVIGAIALLIGTLVIGLMMLISDGVRDLFGGLVTVIVGSVVFVLQGIYKGLIFLLSLIPSSDSHQTILEESATAAPSAGQELIPMDVSGLVPALIAIVVIAAVVIFAITLLKMRRTRTKQVAVIREHREGVVVKNRLWEKITAFFHGMVEKIKFQYRYLCNQNTPQGLLVRIERYGRMKKIPRGKGESPAEYVKRVGRFMVQENLIPEDESYHILAEELDEIFYSGKRTPKETGRLSKETIASIRKSLA